MKDKKDNAVFETIADNFKSLTPGRMANHPGAMIREDFQQNSPKGQQSRIEQLRQAIQRKHKGLPTIAPDLSNA